MKLFNKNIGSGNPCFIIAEAGINHNGSMDKAIEMINIAAKAGVDAIKFQKRNLKALYRTDALSNSSKESHSLGVYIPILYQCELSEDNHKKIFDECHKKGIAYLCSAWDIPSVDFLERLGVRAYKIPSACFSDIFLIKRVIETGKPMILSTGMHSEKEMDDLIPEYLAMDSKNHLRPGIALMHCISSYPTDNKDINLGFMINMKKKYDVPIGYSGHERGIPTSVAAVAMGANLLERHFTLDRTLPGPDHSASIEPHGLETLVRHVRAVEEAMGSEKKVNQGEKVAREILGKSLTWARSYSIESENIIEEKSFCATSPGYGIPPNEADKFFGLYLRHNVWMGEKVELTDFMEADFIMSEKMAMPI